MVNDDQDQEREPADDEEGDDERTRDPDKRRLSQEAAMWRTRFRKAEARIQELEADDSAGTDALRTSRLETAFLREVLGRPDTIGDLETAWDLATLRGFLDPVKIDDDGAVLGMPEAMDRLLARYPYLLDERADGQRAHDAAPRQHTAGSGPITKRQPAMATRVDLEQQFPALRRRR